MHPELRLERAEDTLQVAARQLDSCALAYADNPDDTERRVAMHHSANVYSNARAAAQRARKRATEAKT